MKDFNLNIGGILGGLVGLAAVCATAVLLTNGMLGSGLTTGLAVTGGAIAGNWLWNRMSGRPRH
jgi:hypothetical protein